ncbi:SRPBCC domain-containing protein [Methylovirgula sp. 4M-Z18]|uniref:SRPBCC domain-containing protein n=1 Tax=Methylovirgula sp. 4M-Z18 TaxID=2293567 RepID=UPI000E2EA942|nr:SRPBCC domain-containing protein [Methylovirgula sp. 4M-Z18]RFB79026.1 SRPBCC domain-containing protein [Methylovirgula sp. 4M-Z18]
MLTTNASRTNSKLIIDRAAHSIRLEREFSAPRMQVFEAWTRPEHVACWWDPSGERLMACEIDLRPGGAFKFVMKARPEMPFAGTYLEIAPPDRLVFEALAATGRVLLHESAGKTRLSVQIECRSAQHLDQFLEMGVDRGTSQTLDNLVTYVGVASRSAANA